MDWNIRFTTNGKAYRLGMLAECEILASVENLADTATIILPETVMNEVLNFEHKIQRGTEVLVQLGYNEELVNEFTGFVKEITNNDSSLKIRCEDALFLFRTGIPDTELKPTSLQAIGQYVVSHVDPSYKVVCDFDLSYEKFTIHQAEGYDVLKKIQQETGGHIYFNTEKKELHIHPPFFEKGKQVFYSMQWNIEENPSLEYKNRLDTKVEVSVESTDTKGVVHKVIAGTTEGTKVNIKVGSMSEESMQRIADAALLKRNAPAYEGSFDTWLLPFVKPTDSARIKDEDYPEKTAFYYVKGVKTNFSENGGQRTITPGIKLN